MIKATAIRKAISELLEGTIGTTRHLGTSEYLSVDSNNFGSWTAAFCTVTADQGFGPNGEYTADKIVGNPPGLITNELDSAPDNTEVTGTVYAWTESGQRLFRINFLRKDNTQAQSSSFVATTAMQQFSYSADLLSGGTTPAIYISLVTGSSTTNTMLVAEAHVTSDNYDFGKIEKWDSAIAESFVENLDGKLVVNTRYNIDFPHTEQHSSSPVSAIGSHKVDQQDIVITLYHQLPSNIQEDERNEIRDRVVYMSDRARQALSFPNNLDTTASATSTGIVSGMLFNLTHDVEGEYWDEDPPRIVSQIRGKALLHITQLTS